MYPAFELARFLYRCLQEKADVSYLWIPRIANKAADSMARSALRELEQSKSAVWPLPHAYQQVFRLVGQNRASLIVENRHCPLSILSDPSRVKQRT